MIGDNTNKQSQIRNLEKEINNKKKLLSDLLDGKNSPSGQADCKPVRQGGATTTRKDNTEGFFSQLINDHKKVFAFFMIISAITLMIVCLVSLIALIITQATILIVPLTACIVVFAGVFYKKFEFISEWFTIKTEKNENVNI